MKILNYLFFLFAFQPFFLIAQDKSEIVNDILNYRVYGYSVSQGQYFLATENGFILIDNIQNSKSVNWQNYYRKIYNDTTLTSPNSIIGETKNKFPLNIFLPLKLNNLMSNHYTFTDKYHLYDFIEIDSSGNYNYRPGILGIIDGLEKKSGLTLPSNK